MTARITKLLLLFSGLLLSLSLAAQYPNNPIKSRLGWQTTGDGLVYRGAGAPAYSPGTLFNAWMYLDTTNFVLYGYIGFQWQRLPLVNNGLNADGAYHQLGGSLVENTTVSTGTYNLILGKTSGTNYAYTNIYGSGEGAGLFNSYQNGDYEVEINAQGGVGVMQVENFVDGGNSSLTVNRDGFTFSYLNPSLGISQFTMDSANFFIRSLPSFASHAAADAGTSTYQMYTLDNSRRIYVNQGTATSDILGTGTANRIALWTTTNTLGPSNIQDNGTAVSILNNKPFLLGQWTTAGRPSGTAGYMGWRDGTTFEWYNGTRWAAGLESTAATFTAGSIIFADANGQATQNNTNLFWSESQKQLTARGNTVNAYKGILYVKDNNGGNSMIMHDNGYLLLTDPSTGVGFSHNADGGAPRMTFINANIFSIGKAGDNIASNHLGFLRSSSTRMDMYVRGKMSVGSTGALTADYTIDMENSTDGLRLSSGTTAQTPTEVGGLIRFNSDSTLYQIYSSGARSYVATRAYARTMKDGNGIISALPTGNVSIKTANHLYLKTTGGATGTDIYTGGSTYLKTATGDFGGALFFADTTGNLDYAYGWQQDDRTTIQNGGTGRQVTNLLTDYNPTVNFRWVNGVRLDTTTSVHVMRIMWGDKNTNEAFPTEFIFNAAMPAGSTASAYNFRTAHNTGRLSLNFDNGIYLKKDRKFFLEADSTFAYSFTDNTLRLSSYGNGGKTAAALSLPTPTHLAGFVPSGVGQGTIVDYPISSIPTIYTASDSIRGDRYLETANDGSATTALGYFPSFPDLNYSESEKGIYIGPGYWNEISMVYNTSVSNGGIGQTNTNSFLYKSSVSDSRNGGIVAQMGRIVVRARGSSDTNKLWEIDIDSISFKINRNIGGTLRNYELLPASEYPSATSAAKTVLQWTGDGTNANPAFVEVKRDTTVYVVDTDLDWSAAITTAQVASRFNRVIFLMTTTGAAGSNSDLTLHTPDINLMQVEYLIRSTDEAGGFANTIQFGSNNAVQSDNTLTGTYTPAPGQGVGIRAGLRSGTYKYWYY